MRPSSFPVPSPALRSGRALRSEGSLPSLARSASILVALLLVAATARAAAPAPDSLRMMVRADRMYAIRGEEIAAEGIDLATLRAERLGLFEQGRPVPMRIEGAGPDGAILPATRILFRGRYPRNDEGTAKDILTDENPFILVFESPEATPRVETAPPSEPSVEASGSTGTVTTHRRVWRIEQDNQIKNYQFFDGPPTDRVIWSVIDSPPKKSAQRFPALADAADPEGAVRARVFFWGSSRLPMEPDHRWSFSIGGVELGRAEWDDVRNFVLEGDVPVSAFQTAKENRLEATNLHEGEVVDAILLDWIELEYEARLVPSRDSLDYELEGTPARVRVGPGFSSEDVRVWDLTDGIEIPLAKQSSRSGWSVEYSHPFEGRRRFAAFVDSKVRSPDRLIVGRPAGLKAMAASPDRIPEYLIVTHPRFLDAAAPLAAHRERGGLRSLVANVDDIYAEYSHGRFSPAAIRAFLDDLIAGSEGSERPLKYVLLLGDATYDYRNIKKGSPNYVPTRHAEETALHIDYAPTYAYDDWFALGRTPPAPAAPDGNAVPLPSKANPRVAVGRLPVNEPGEVLQYVAKVMDFEAKQGGRAEDDDPLAWSRRGLLIAAEGFDGYSEALATRELAGWELDKVFAKPGAVEENENLEDRIVESIDRGVGFVHFIGHGAEFMWRTGSFDPKKQTDMFTDEEIARLKNRGRYPVVFASTCFSALFDTHGHQKSGVGVSLVLAAERGAIACVAHVGKAPVTAGHEFAKAMMAEFMLPAEGAPPRVRRLGDAFLAAKNRFGPSMAGPIALIGDPALDFGDRYAKTAPSATDQEAAEPSGETDEADEKPVPPTLADDQHRVRIAWKTETETDSFGYFVFRADSPEAEPVCLNPDRPVPGAGTTTTPRRYVYFDLTVEPGRTYHYKVRQTDLDGTSEWIIGDEGPVAASAKAIKPEEREEIEKRGDILWSEEAL